MSAFPGMLGTLARLGTYARGLRISGAGRVWALIAIMTALAVALYVSAIHGLDRGPIGPVALPWWAFAIFFFLAEAYVVHLHFRSEAHTLSLSELGLVLGLFCTSPQGLILAQLCGAGAALVFHRRQRPLKVAFNLSLFALCTNLALDVFYSFADPARPYGVATIAGAFLAVAFSTVSGVVLVALAISLAEGKQAASTLVTTLMLAVVGGVVSASVALASVELMRLSLWLLVLQALPAGGCALAFLAYTTQRRRHEHLGFLYESMRATQAARDFDSVAREFLRGAREMARAEVAELVLFPSSDADQALRSVIAPNGETAMQTTQLTTAERLAVEVSSAGTDAILLARGRSSHVLDVYLAERGLKDALLIALRRETGVFGLLLVGDRAGDVSTFDHDDRKLFETFASHASVLLENDRLEQSLATLSELQEQLRHQAFHDALTGLPNRSLFSERVAEALEQAAAGGAAPAVLFLDLDDFKAINDSLGHAAGDELLTAVAERVRASVRPGDIPARLGGDEFAVLISDPADGDPQSIAERLVKALAAPLVLHGREVPITGSIGIAVAERATRTADELLRNADIAMYSAKANGKRGYAIYEPQMHTQVRQRHELAAALDRALERAEIEVHYQPIVELETGQTAALEALARWRHPTRGLVPPAAFIPVGEEMGAMIPIGRAILEQACLRTREWQSQFSAHSRLSISVNLAPSELRNPRLVEEVASILAHTGLEPGCLMLEITEHGALRDLEAAIATMHSLRSLGVRLALDDFGTGHSSLSHLRDLPVDVLKVAKPFVDRLRDFPPDSTFVDAILRLATALGLETIAEGIEHRSQAKQLRGLGCELGQGFYFARPLDRSGLEEHLRAASPPAPTASNRPHLRRVS